MPNPLRLRVLIVGCGAMGRALLTGWLMAGNLCEVTIVDPFDIPPFSITPQPKMSIYKDVSAIPEDNHFDLIVFAIKPQNAAEVLPSYRSFLNTKNTVLSIMAGKDLAFYRDIFGEDKAIVRAMPNMPALLGQGMTVLSPNRNVKESRRMMLTQLLKSNGETLWLEDESLMHAATAISGSGPAYVYAFTESLRQAGEDLGLPPTQAARLARQTVIGAAAVLSESSQTAAHLRAEVTSKGGTTAAALDILQGDKDRLTTLLAQATKAAEDRSRAL